MDYNDVDFCVKLMERGYRVVYTLRPALSFRGQYDRTGQLAAKPPGSSKMAALGRCRSHYNVNLSRNRLTSPYAVNKAFPRMTQLAFRTTLPQGVLSACCHRLRPCPAAPLPFARLVESAILAAPSPPTPGSAATGSALSSFRQ